MVLPAPESLQRLVAVLAALAAVVSPQNGNERLATIVLPQNESLTLEPLGPDGHVIIVIVDGLRPDLISVENSPTLQRLVDEGAATLEAQTVRPSITLPSITSMLTGLRPRDHGILWNDYRPDLGIVSATTVFDIVHEAGLKTAFFSGKVKMRHAAPPDALDAVAVRFLPDVSIVTLARNALAELRPSLMVVHLPNMDRTGHEFGWASDEQIRTLRATDIALASLIDAIESDPLLGPTRVILTADHGGSGDNHQRGVRRDLTVPWILWGDGVESVELDPVSVTVTAATALKALGLEPLGTMARGLPR